MKKIHVIGAGPGGLASALLLQKQGFEVTIFEKDHRVGGRSKRVTLGDYHFDLGPTFLMYIDVLKEIFSRAGFDLFKELELIELETLYHLHFKNQIIVLTNNRTKNALMYDKLKPGLGNAYLRWYKDQEIKLDKLKPILEKPFPSFFHLLRKDVLKAIPIVHPFKSVYSLLKTYDKDPLFIHSLSFQAKYLGMASYQAPSIFTMLPYLEHHTGLYHVKGGLNQINEVMAKLFVKLGGTLKLNSKVDEIVIENKEVKGIMCMGDFIPCDDIVMNVDFAYGMTHLINSKLLKKYTPKKLEKKKYSISTWMMYLGVNQELELPHHEILFSDDYDQYLHDLMENKFTDDISIYIHNPSKIDDTLAPEKKSSLYILVPVPNNFNQLSWIEKSIHIEELVFKRIYEKHQIDLKPFIEEKMIYTPSDWEIKENVYRGAVFNLSHQLNQMLFMRPHNQFEEFKHMYLVGGGTHPGSGLPTIYQSALIIDNMIVNRKK